jgi:hypothetical protein
VLLLSASGLARSFGCAEKGRLGRVANPDEADASIGDAEPAARPALMQRAMIPTPVPGMDDVAFVAAVRRDATHMQPADAMTHAGRLCTAGLLLQLLRQARRTGVRDWP